MQNMTKENGNVFSLLNAPSTGNSQTAHSLPSKTCYRPIQVVVA